MSGKRIGERLSGFVTLSGHDIEEILSEQNVTGKPFGEVALQLGLCKPEDVWRAWSSQLAENPQRIDLDKVGVDSQALSRVDRETAVRYHIVPVRLMADILVVAVDEAVYSTVAVEIGDRLPEKVLFVLSNHAKIARAIRNYYPRETAAA